MEIRKILVVDDDQPISSYLQRKFTKLGYTVHVAEDGDEAIQKTFSYLPDIILLDVKLPKLSGTEVCKKLKADIRTKDIPILFLSAKAQAVDIEEGLNAGADRYLCKPMSFLDILSEIHRYESQ